MINVNRSPEPPISLAMCKSWRSDDVLERLHSDFLGKCYLTEEVLTLGRISVDHFRPKGMPEFEHLTYEWSNLYPTSVDTNSRRLKWPEGGLLDPAAPDEDIEKRLQQWLDDNCLPKFAATDPDDLKAVNTAHQLDHIHNARHPKAADLREAIRTYYIKVLEKLHELRDAVDSQPQKSVDITKLKTELSDMLSRHAPFTALIRSTLINRWPYSEYFD